MKHRSFAELGIRLAISVVVSITLIIAGALTYMFMTLSFLDIDTLLTMLRVGIIAGIWIFIYFTFIITGDRE